MARTIVEKRNAFRALHREKCFILPNPRDVDSTRMMEHMGFSAQASTSPGYSWSRGRPPTTPPSRCYARASSSPRWRTVSGRFKVSMSVP
ncbi:hypothetical protein FW320_00060 [Azospirillum sp. Vi22]|uniref:isocitrate lyase/phosphoenolpyruvate mutase family protein n=1 Tax=Azospirillum baldaniorum TaxID=1064539 RepID=UPI00157B2C94|nr:hypothetical protein [Azospirillum baldaniorum]